MLMFALYLNNLIFPNVDRCKDPVAFQEDQIQRLAAAQQSLHTTFVQVLMGADGMPVVLVAISSCTFC